MMAMVETPTRTRDARYDLDSLPAFLLDRFSQNTRSPSS